MRDIYATRLLPKNLRNSKHVTFVLLINFICFSQFIGCTRTGSKKEALLTLVPLAPSGFTNGTITQNSLSFSWTDNAYNETGFEIQSCQGTDCTNFTTLSTSPLAANTTTFSLSSLPASTTYKFRLRAINSYYQSDYLVSGNITTSAAPTVTPAREVSSCSTKTVKIVDYGEKGIAPGVGRGLFSDTKIIPTTQNPATAFVDSTTTGGKLAVMITWYDGENFQVEAVSGTGYAGTPGTATFVRLAFLTQGSYAKIPMVFWTDASNSVAMAMRSAPLGTSGTWTHKVLETLSGATTRALEVEVSPADHVGLIYISAANLGIGYPRFMYCDAPCTSVNSFLAMDATNNGIDGTNTAIVNTVGTGIAWCKVGSTYKPGVTFGRNGLGIRYATCLGDLSTCRSTDGSGWSGITVSANISAVNSKVRIDPDTVGTTETPKVLTHNAANTALGAFEITSTSGCAAAPTGVSANSNTFGGATTGNAWSKLLEDDRGFFHVVANLGTTSVSYFNSTTTTFSSTNFNQTPAVGTIETLTLPIAGSGAGGAALTDSTTAQVYASYAPNATPYFLHLGVVNDFTISSSNSELQSYYTVYPDITGNINLGFTSSQVRNISLQATTEDHPGIAYVDHSVGVIPSSGTIGTKLKYAYRDGTLATDTWSVTTVPLTGYPSSVSLRFDHNNKPWISYYDAIYVRYYLVTNTMTDGSGTWSRYQFPQSGKTATATLPATDDTSLAMYVSGGIHNPVMFIINSTAAGTAGVKVAKLDYTTRKWSVVTLIDALGAQFGTQLTTDYNSSGGIAVSYYNLLTATPRINFNYSTNPISWNNSIVVASTSAGREGLNLKINSKTGLPALSYYDRSANTVYYNSCSSNNISDCSTSPSSWAGNNTLTTVDNAAGVSDIIANNEQVLSTSLSFDFNGKAYIAYPRGIGATTPALILSNNVSGSFAATTLQSAPSAKAQGANGMNYALTGLNVSSLRLSNDNFISAYVGPGNYLNVLSCGEE
jgi:hypothetical protein